MAAFINDLKQLAPTDRPTAADAVQRLRQLEMRPRRIAQAAAAALLAVLAISGATKYTVDLRRERAAAVASEHRATIARQEAATRRAQAEDLITFMLGDLRTKLEPLGKLDVLDDVGERALAYSASLDPALMSSDELARSAKALGQLGGVRIAQGRLAEAAPVFAQSLQMARAAVRKEAKNQNAQLAQMAAHFGVGECARLSGRSAEALREMELYLATARKLSAANPANAEYRMEQAYGHANVGTLLMGSGRFAEAGAHFAEALRIKRARLARDPSNAEWRADLANTVSKLGMNLHKTGDLAGARVQFEEQKRIREELVAAAPDDAQAKYRLAIARGHLATVLLSMGDTRAAERELHAELEIERVLATQDGGNVIWARNLAVTTARIAAVDARQDRTAEAAMGFRRAVSMLEEVVSRDPSRVAFRGDLDVIRARSVVNDLARGDLTAARRTWERVAPTADGHSSETPERQMELLLAAMIVGDATQDVRQSSECRERARSVLAIPSLQASTDPEVIAARARLLVALDQRSEAAPLMARLDAIGYRHPDYEWSIRGQ
jgi:serine/threonine-protein kinase